jgi:tRNA uridine 5-carboxymethylaminomethyl modification enzyme
MSIRSDNADVRLTEKGLHSLQNCGILMNTEIDVGRQVGAVSDERWSTFQAVQSEIAEASKLLKEFSLTPQVSSDL